MDLTGRRKSVAGWIALAVGLIAVLIVLYIGYILLNWRNGILLVLGVLLVLLIISGILVNTIFLVREIRRNEQHDAFINAVTHELKTPIASIRLYLQTLQTRPVDEVRRSEFYRIMLEDSDRLLSTIEQVLRTGRVGSPAHHLHRTRIDLDEVVRLSVERVRMLHNVSAEGLRYQPGGPATVMGDLDEVGAAVTNLVDNAVKYFRFRGSGIGGDGAHERSFRNRARTGQRSGYSEDRVEARFPQVLPRSRPIGLARERDRTRAVHRAFGGQAARRAGVGGKRGPGTRKHVRAATPPGPMNQAQ